FDPQNPEELSDMILKTLTREAATMERVHGARERVKKHNTIDAMGRDIIRIYRLHQVKLDNLHIPRLNSQIR
ncbi:MAG: glycosyltransferase family 4 protein, partial [Desulfobacteraceae bacterium]|nr:glycosyltransferase family 4 protein [Desulfobacteraceae bacterium]